MTTKTKTQNAGAKLSQNKPEAVQMDEDTSWTIESMVADLPNGVVYLYYYHQFDRSV